jgi:hypothetical protein
VSQKRTEMDQLRELVRLHRMGTGCREVARLLAISPNTERQYREILAAEGLLAGAVEELPELAELKAAVVKYVGEKRTPQQISSVEQWRATVQAMIRGPCAPTPVGTAQRLRRLHVWEHTARDAFRMPATGARARLPDPRYTAPPARDRCTRSECIGAQQGLLSEVVGRVAGAAWEETRPAELAS